MTGDRGEGMHGAFIGELKAQIYILEQRIVGFRSEIARLHEQEEEILRARDRWRNARQDFECVVGQEKLRPLRPPYIHDTFCPQPLHHAYGALAQSGLYRSGGLCADDLTAPIQHFSMIAALTNLLIQRSAHLLANVAAGFAETDQQLAAELQAQG
jgi:hypothetical protein